MNKLTITCYTDPVCTWCWGMEPILRKIELHYGRQIKFEHIMGGLVQDINHFYDSYNDIGGSDYLTTVC